MTDGTRSRRWQRPGRFLRDLNIVALLLLLVGAAGLFMSPRSDDVLLGLPDLQLNDKSPRTIRSPRALTITDPENTRRLQDEAATRVAPVFDQEVWLVEHAERRVAAAFEVLTASSAAEASSAEVEAYKEAFSDALGVVIDERTLGAVLQARPDEMRDAVLSVLSSIGERPIVARARDLPPGATRLTILEIAQDGRTVREVNVDDLSVILTLDQARAEVDARAAERLAHLPAPQRQAAAVLAKELLDDNLVRNTSATLRRRRRARTSVKPSVIAIAPGEVVVRSGARVDEQKLRILKGMAAELESINRFQVSIGRALMVVLLVVFAYRIALRAYRPTRPDPRDLAFLASSVLLTMLSLWAGYHGVVYLVDFIPSLPTPTLRMGLPVAFGVLLVRLVASAEAAAAFAPVVAMMAGWIMDASLPYAAYTVAGALAAASVSDRARLSRSLAVAASRIIIAQATVVTALDLMESNADLATFGEHLAAAVVSGALSVTLAAAALPVVEAVFGYATSLRLGQLANLNHPLLKQLLVEAPGTYHHSIMVATMAESAAQAIGAHPLLARVGGYYHDIGKLKNPRAFEENDGREIISTDPVVQATELRAHVQDGVELALQHRLGASVIDILRRHHGTSVVRLRSHPGAQQWAGARPRYAGPKPDSKASALVMLADCVEAATRSLEREPVVPRHRIEEAVDETVQSLLQAGQLDDCELTLRELELTRRAFIDVIEARRSRRARPPALGALPGMPSASVVPAPAGEPS